MPLDWRDAVAARLETKEVRRPARNERRFHVIMDRCMIAATVLSAFATSFAGGIALFQYWNMEAALIAPHRNAAFSEAVASLNEVCSHDTLNLIGGLVGQESGTLKTDNRGMKASVSVHLAETVPNAVRRLHVYEVWVPETREYRTQFEVYFRMLMDASQDTDRPVDELWLEHLELAQNFCVGKIDALVDRFHSSL